MTPETSMGRRGSESKTEKQVFKKGREGPHYSVKVPGQHTGSEEK